MSISERLLSVIALAFLCLPLDGLASNKAGLGAPIKQVAVIKVSERKSLVRELVGVVFSPETQNLSLEVSGIVRSQRLALGTRVRKGDVIIQLDDREAKAQQALAFAETERASVEVKRKLLAFNRAQKTFTNKLSSKVDFEEAELELQQAKSDLMISNARLELASLTAEKYTILAPFDGSLITSTPTYGKQIMPGESVVEIINHDNLSVRAFFSAQEMDKLKRGDARLMLRSTQPLHLELLQYSLATRSANGMFETEFSLPSDVYGDKFVTESVNYNRKTNNDFYSGQAIKLQLMDEHLSVPEQAISMDDTGKYVLTVGDDIAVRVPIDELQIGQKVIVMGHHNLLPGERVSSLVLSETQ